MPDPFAGSVSEVGRVRLGSVYKYRPTGCRYRVLCFAMQGHTRQWQVVYAGLDGADRGSHWCCPVWDFAVKFDPEEEEVVAVGGPTEKVAGAVPGPGSGV